MLFFELLALLTALATSALPVPRFEAGRAVLGHVFTLATGLIMTVRSRGGGGACVCTRLERPRLCCSGRGGCASVLIAALHC